ncbi:putative Leucine-rich repeat protein kinase family protein [Melia azedarach]|uniref:Leucine-rich repeat protein kinase family protein n=1 Tax=Melia azedarach TaxID=155640 RepID=A0ACC1YQ82_MELAZ|nr:putative Leucine-rich repeat protein kinase family protein [Melia azedarach]
MSPSRSLHGIPIFWCINITVFRANETDRIALLTIKSPIHDQPGFTISWNTSVNICNGRGVTCGKRHQRVTGLDLRNQNIRGFLSPYNCSNLIHFNASGNNLVGEILVEIGNLLKLVELLVAGNHLTRQLPASVGSLWALQVLHIATNNLGGTIPDTLGQLRSLKFLSIRQNQFSGMIPPPLCNISSPKTFAIASNRFHGSLPLDMGYTLPNLDQLITSRDNFTGSLPDSLSNATNLVMFDAALNHLGGKVSIDFSGNKNLHFLNVGANNLGNGTADDLEFVNSLVNCSKLQLLGLYRNRFGGMLPYSLANFSTTITGIAMQDIQISGTIPPGIRNLVKLSGLSLQLNRLTGTIRHVLDELKDLQELYLQANNLEGTVLTSLGNLTLLNELSGSQQLGRQYTFVPWQLSELDSVQRLRKQAEW